MRLGQAITSAQIYFRKDVKVEASFFHLLIHCLLFVGVPEMIWCWYLSFSLSPLVAVIFLLSTKTTPFTRTGIQLEFSSFWFHQLSRRILPGFVFVTKTSFCTMKLSFLAGVWKKTLAFWHPFALLNKYSDFCFKKPGPGYSSSRPNWPYRGGFTLTNRDGFSKVCHHWSICKHPVEPLCRGRCPEASAT